ncbi:EF-hand calcium-binding domain-containing protein 9-like [Trichomycterus rosablanca]|uniref:EF-hand calcium-binding domain-containing protein 9-like n=1 Tax=Trichomycterus rosablanca TaxID=2290929 RepID=UPI002F358F50
MLDAHNTNTLNDIQFYKHVTDLKKKEIMLTFDMLDWNSTGEIGFDEFYMLVCVLLCTEHHTEKHFLSQHSRTVFELMDRDGDGAISLSEFQDSGFLFNLESYSLKTALHELDFSEHTEETLLQGFKGFCHGLH